MDLQAFHSAVLQGFASFVCEMTRKEKLNVFIRNPNNNFNSLTQIHVCGRAEETLLMPLVYFST